jgi:hypothetical protein
MKPGGGGIFQVPYLPQQALTDEDPSVTDPRERERRFGQYDHVRVYGKDYADRLREAGFDVEVFQLSDHIDPDLMLRYRMPAGEPLMICRKSN